MRKTVFAVLAAVLICFSAGGQELRLTLAQCREMALQNNSSAVGAALDLKAAEYQKQEAFAEYFPRVSAMGFGFWAFDPLVEIGIKDVFGNNDFSNNLQNIVESFGVSPYYSTMNHGYLAGISVTQPLFAGGRIVNGNRLASIGVEAARLQLQMQRRTTAGEIEGYWWQVVSLQEKQKTLGGFLEFIDTLYRDVSVAYKAGLVTEDELLQVTLNRNQLRSSEVQLRNGMRLAKMNLLNSIGQDYTVISANACEERPYIDSVVFDDEFAEPEAPDRYYVDEESIAASMEETKLLDLQVEAASIGDMALAAEAFQDPKIDAYPFTWGASLERLAPHLADPVPVRVGAGKNLRGGGEGLFFAQPGGAELRLEIPAGMTGDFLLLEFDRPIVGRDFRVVWEDVLAGRGQPWIEFWGGSNCYLIPLDTSPNWLLSPWKRNCRVKLPGTFAGEFRLLRAEFLRRR